MKVDDIMKFFHAYDGGNETNKRKSSFWFNCPVNIVFLKLIL